MVDSEEDEEGAGAGNPRPLAWPALAGSFAQFCGNVARSVVALSEDVSTMMAHHTAYRWRQADMYEATQREIESLPTTVER